MTACGRTADPPPNRIKVDEPRAPAAPQAAVAPTSAPAASMRLGTRTTTPRRPASGRGARLTGGTGGAGHAPKPAAGPALHDQHERKGSHGDAPDARSSAHQRLPRRSRRSHPILARPDATSATAGTGPAGRSVGGGTVTWTWESPLGPHTTGQGNTEPETTRVIEFDPSRPHPARVYQACCAMRRSAISLAQRGEMGGVSLDPMAYPAPKGNIGGKSMPGN